VSADSVSGDPYAVQVAADNVERGRRREAAVAAILAAHEGVAGHAWELGPYARECLRCGLCVAAGGSYRVVSRGGARAIVWPGHHGALPPCLDGAVGAITTAREAVWLWCDQ
jgi:hypothetical protein